MTRIVCIEDEVDFRQTLVEFLEDLGYEVIEAGNGAEGLQTILQNKPALIICDRMMPEGSGAELLQTLRNDHPDLDGIPFIFLTALADRRDVHATAELSPAAYLTKPLDFERLEEMVGNLLGSVDQTCHPS